MSPLSYCIIELFLDVYASVTISSDVHFQVYTHVCSYSTSIFFSKRKKLAFEYSYCIKCIHVVKNLYVVLAKYNAWLPLTIPENTTLSFFHIKFFIIIFHHLVQYKENPFDGKAEMPRNASVRDLLQKKILNCFFSYSAYHLDWPLP